MNSHFIAISFLFLAAWTDDIFSKSLPLPPESQSVISIERIIRGFSVLDDKLIILPLKKNLFIHVPFHPEGKTNQEKFGKLIESRRVAFPEIKVVPAWGYTLPIANKLFIVDTHDLNITVIDSENYEVVAKQSIAWDMILPYRDKGGEAPKGEVAQLRDNFKKAFMLTEGERISGITEFPRNIMSEKDLDKHFFLMSLRVKGYPFVIMECGGNPIAQCRISRVCPPAQLIRESAANWQGLSFLPNSKQFLIADQKKHELLLFTYNSCPRIEMSSTSYKVPNRIKNLVDIHIDQKSRLWLASQVADDYFNASLFYWEKDEWY